MLLFPKVQHLLLVILQALLHSVPHVTRLLVSLLKYLGKSHSLRQSRLWVQASVLLRFCSSCRCIQPGLDISNMVTDIAILIHKLSLVVLVVVSRDTTSVAGKVVRWLSASALAWSSLLVLLMTSAMGGRIRGWLTRSSHAVHSRESRLSDNVDLLLWSVDWVVWSLNGWLNCTLLALQ